MLPLTGADVTLDSDDELILGGTVQTMRASGNVVLGANHVLLESGGDLQYGTLDVDAREVSLQANVSPHSAPSQSSVEINAETINIGTSGADAVIIESQQGTINIGGTATANGTLTVTGEVVIDSTGPANTDTARQPAEAQPGDVDQAGADVSLRAGAQIGTLNVTAGAGDRLLVVAGTGDLEIGKITRTGLTAINSLRLVANNIQLNAAGRSGNTIDIDASGDVTAAGALTDDVGSITIDAAGVIRLEGMVSAGGELSLASAGTTLGGSDAVVLQGPVAGAIVTVSSASGGVRPDDTVTSDVGAVTIQGAERVSVAGNITAGGELVVAPASTNIVSQDAVVLQGTVAAGSIEVRSESGNVRLEEAVSIALSGAEQVAVTGAITASAGLTVESRAATLTVSDAVVLGGSVTAAIMSVTSEAGNLSFAQPLTTTGEGASDGGLTIANDGVITFDADVSAQGELAMTSAAVARTDLRDSEDDLTETAINASGRLTGGHVSIAVAAGDVSLAEGVAATASGGQSGGIRGSVSDGDLTIAADADTGSALLAQAGEDGGVALDVSRKLDVSGLTNNSGSFAASAESIVVSQTLTASDITLNATDNVDVTVTDPAGDVGDGLVSTVGEVSLTSKTTDVLVNSNISSASDITLVAVEGSVAQGRNSTADATDGSLTISALEGVDIATVIAQGDVTLVLTKEVGPNDEAPMFRRVNDPIAFEDSGDVNEGKLADITSETGTITFLAPSANVGSVDADQNFVQRASEGIFYGLNSGRFFSDDIGSTSLLQTIPTDALATFETQIDELNLLPPTDVSLLVNNLVDSSRATASAGNTTAASSSRSTAASQRGEEEEVAEVDEQAFVNLVTFDAPPDSVRLPEDQVQLAIDREGTMYYLVDVDTGRRFDERSWVLFEVRLDLQAPATILAGGDNRSPGFTPVFVTLDQNGAVGGAE
ncbi:MAG: hypothetical protein CMQ24_06765 [Gammaproteobacteria bacterium]|nr:hypothetical protein [Gammaproteobacteria bacterium]